MISEGLSVCPVTSVHNLTGIYLPLLFWALGTTDSFLEPTCLVRWQMRLRWIGLAVRMWMLLSSTRNCKIMRCPTWCVCPASTNFAGQWASMKCTRGSMWATPLMWRSSLGLPTPPPLLQLQQLALAVAPVPHRIALQLCQQAVCRFPPGLSMPT